MHVPELPGWRTIPTETVVSLITKEIGAFPPSLLELETLARLHEYGVVFLPQSVQERSRTQHNIRVIYITEGSPDRMLADMLHELSEVLLRSPIAEEFHHPLTGQDENHNVSVLATDDLLERIRTERERLLHENERLETLIGKKRAKIQGISEHMQVCIGMLQQGNYDVVFPDTTLLKRDADDLKRLTEQQALLQSRIRGF